MRITRESGYGRRLWWHWLNPWCYLALVGVLLCVVFIAQVGHCVWCPDWECWRASHCWECVCMRRDHRGGICVHISSVSELEANGWYQVSTRMVRGENGVSSRVE